MYKRQGSLLRDEARRPRSPDVSESLRLLREDLAYLEKLVLPDAPADREPR